MQKDAQSGRIIWRNDSPFIADEASPQNAGLACWAWWYLYFLRWCFWKSAAWTAIGSTSWPRELTLTGEFQSLITEGLASVIDPSCLHFRSDRPTTLSYAIHFKAESNYMKINFISENLCAIENDLKCTQ